MNSDQFSTYKRHLTSTIEEMYPKYSQKDILKGLEKKQLVKLKKHKIIGEDRAVLDLSEIAEESNRLTTGIQESQEVVRFIERTEFLKSYRYAVLFSVNNLDEGVFSALSEDEDIIDHLDPDFSHDIMFDELTDDVITPTKYAIGNVVMFKFSKLLTGFVPGSGIKKQIKFPILAIFFKHLNVLEIRLDQVRSYFQEDEFFYHKQINFVLEWVKEKIECEIDNINLPPIIETIRKQDLTDVNIHAQSMSLKSGGKAVLEAGISENIILPLLGELKELLKVNEDLFNKSPEIKKLLDNFILETEETSDLPWVSLIWKNEKKSKATIVKFRHNYMNQEYTLLQYIGIETRMERMDNVTEYIINSQKYVDEKEQT